LKLTFNIVYGPANSSRTSEVYCVLDKKKLFALCFTGFKTWCVTWIYVNSLISVSN